MKSVPRSGPTWEAVFSYSGKLVSGIDEVGRGCWAGPVTSAAVILPFGVSAEGVDDSKKLSHAQRLRLDRAIRQRALAIGIGWVSPSEVDKHGLTWAIRESGLRAVADCGMTADIIVLDGNQNFLKEEYNSICIVGADATVTPVASASVIAKVARDRYMEVMARRYPEYGFEAHKGYGTAYHRAALASHGITPLHRRSYKPLKEYGHDND